MKPLPRCRECGGECPRSNAVFCSAVHRTDWQNRRRIRGAELYDLVMAWRYERSHSGQARSILANLARAYHDADKTLRDGRPSWNYQEALARLPMAYSSDGDGR